MAVVTDLLRWAWWRVRQIDPADAGFYLFMAVLSLVVFFVIFGIATIEVRVHCEPIERRAAAFEECVASEQCQYTLNDVDHQLKRKKIIAEHCPAG